MAYNSHGMEKSPRKSEISISPNMATTNLQLCGLFSFCIICVSLICIHLFENLETTIFPRNLHPQHPLTAPCSPHLNRSPWGHPSPKATVVDLFDGLESQAGTGPENHGSLGVLEHRFPKNEDATCLGLGSSVKCLREKDGKESSGFWGSFCWRKQARS